MKCPEDIAEVLLRIIDIAFLSIRQLGNKGLAEDCEIEADHVHNLPVLLQDYSPKLLEFYWNVERVCFLNRREENSLQQYQKEWNTLRLLMNQHGIPIRDED